MLIAVIVPATFLMGAIVGGIGSFFFVDDTAFAPRTDPGSFAEQDDFGTRKLTEGACVDLATRYTREVRVRRPRASTRAPNFPTKGS
jgi:hypothetical protein